MKVLVAVAWPYASGPRHIGHVAGFGVPSDVFARYHRLRGDDVLMVSGTDEHGTPITVAAEREGVSPRELADRYNEVIAADLRRLGLSYDLFTRTTTANHHRVVQDLFRKLHDAGHVVAQRTLGAFSAATGRTLPDRYIEGTCPACGDPGARGDQCEACGRQLDPTDLVEPRSTIDGRPPEFRETEHFLLDLAAFAGPLREWIEAHDAWRPNVRSFSLNLLDDLRPRAITRDLDWGVPIPIPAYEDKRIYVWFDAVIGYLSASVEWAAARGEPEAWRAWWQDPAARHWYFMGKDNIVFHSIIWPSILLGSGDGLRLPDEIVASEFLTMEGRKFSSSRRVAIYVQDFLERYDADALRYVLTAAGPETQDTDFTWNEFVRRNNDELVAAWGNLVHRTLTTAHKRFGHVPHAAALEPDDTALIESVERGFESVGERIERARFKAALAEAMRLAGETNRYFSQQAPWKQPDERAATVVATALRCVGSLNVMLAPFLPHSSGRLDRLLGGDGSIAPLPESSVGAEGQNVLTGDYTGMSDRWRPAPPAGGRPLPPPEPLFRKLDDAVAEAELARMQSG